MRWCRPLLLLLSTSAAWAAPSDVRIITEPDGVEVWVGEIRLGVTTRDGLLLTAVQPGSVTYTLRKPGYVQAARTVRVEDTGQPLTILVHMTPAEPGPAPAPTPPSAAGPPAGAAQAPIPAKPATPTGSAERPAKAAKRSHAVPIVLGVAAAAAAAGAVVVLTKKDPLEIDDDGDGFSEKQGDCNDLDREISPRGEFSFTVNPDVVGSVNCNSGFNRLEIFATNLGCTTVTINSVTLTTFVASGNCFANAPTTNIPVSSPTVGPGSRNLPVASRQFGGTVGCCSGGLCAGSVCTFGETYTLTTSTGQRSSSNSYSIVFPRGFSCVACPSSLDATAKYCAPISVP
jgi:hypothetical protein